MQILPLCVCLMESKSEHTYTILLQAIKELNPGFKPDKIHTDFEFAEYNSFKKVFVDATVEGCLYHYSNVSKFSICFLSALLMCFSFAF